MERNDKEKSVKRTVLSILPVALVFWACTTVPEPAGEEGGINSGEPNGRGAVKVVETPVEPELPPGPLLRLDTISSYLANGVLDTVTTMIYKNALLVEERVAFADGSPAGHVFYSYQEGLLVKSVKTDGSGKTLSARGYAYDGAGNLAEETFLDAAGSPIFAYRFAYDSDNRRIALDIVSSDGQTLSYAEYRYSGGRNDKIETFNLMGEMQESMTRIFDD